MRLARTVLLLVSLGMPTTAAWLYFVRPTDNLPLVWASAKAIQASLPLVGWFLLGMDRRCVWNVDRRMVRGGLASGILLSLPILLLYYAARGHSPWLEASREAISARLAAFGATSWAGFLAIALTLSLAHSLFEEYYWRWFVFDALLDRSSLRTALAVSGAAFAAHHVIVLDRLMGGRPLLAALFALGVVGAGAFWAWQRHRDGSLVTPWISHAVVDATIFWIGWEIAG